MNQPMSLKFKNYLHITALHMITFYNWETLICHSLIKVWRTCMICLNWIIWLKTQHVWKAQIIHVLRISILTKRQCILIYLLSWLTFLTTIVWFLYYLQLNIWQLNIQHSQYLKKQKSQSTEISHRLQSKFIGNSNIGRKVLESFKDCLTFLENWFCLHQRNLAL